MRKGGATIFTLKLIINKHAVQENHSCMLRDYEYVLFMLPINWRTKSLEVSHLNWATYLKYC